MKTKMYVTATADWIATLDKTVAVTRSLSRGELLERLLAQEQARVGVPAVPRLEGSPFNPWTREHRVLPGAGGASFL